MSFIVAFDATMGHEGGYVHDPDDAGGETYRGIARRFNPAWNGWRVIDDAKGNGTDINALRSQLAPNVRAFYKARYWDPWRGDEVDQYSDALSAELFDTAVNMGVRRAVKFLQRSLNALNRNGKLFPDLVDDGVFGNVTMGGLDVYFAHDEPGPLLTLLNIHQGMHYVRYMKKSPTQEKYARGWLKRVKFTKEVA